MRESFMVQAQIKITGEAGNVVDLSDGIITLSADGTSKISLMKAKVLKI